MAGSPELPRDEVAAALAARRELGADMEPEIVASLADRIDRVIDARVAARLDERGVRQRKGDGSGPFWMALSSIGAGIGVTAIAGSQAGLPGIFVAWVGIAIVNIVYILGTRGFR